MPTTALPIPPTTHGTAMACGFNEGGQLGLGDTDNRDTFTVVAGLRGVVDIDAGEMFSIAVTCEGEVWTWGRGHAIGHRGDAEGPNSDEDTEWIVPTKVTGGGIDEAAIVQVAASQEYSMALTVTGELLTWGTGLEEEAMPRVVDGIEGAVTGMSGGHMHSLVTTAEGRVLAFGCNGVEVEYDSDDEDLDEPFFAVGRLGLGAGVEEALTPTAIDGIAMGEGGEGKEGKE